MRSYTHATFLDSGVAEASFAATLVPRPAATSSEPTTTCDSINQQHSNVNTNTNSHSSHISSRRPRLLAPPPVPQPLSRSVSQLDICTEDNGEEGELEFDGPEIPDALRETLLVTRTPIQPVLEVAKSLVAKRIIVDNTGKERESLTDSEITDSCDFDTDEGSDMELDNTGVVTIPIVAESLSSRHNQVPNFPEFSASKAGGAVPEKGSMRYYNETGPGTESKLWGSAGTILGNWNGIMASTTSQPGGSGPINMMQTADMSAAPWTQPIDFAMHTTLDSSLHNVIQRPVQQFSSTMPLGQVTPSATMDFSEQEITEEDSTWILGSLPDQTSIADVLTTDMPCSSLVGHTAATSLVPEPPVLEQIGFAAMCYQPEVTSSFQQLDGHIYSQPRQDEAQELQYFVSPMVATFSDSENVTNDHMRCLWEMPPIPSPTESDQDELPQGWTYLGPTLYNPNLENAA